MVPGDLIEWVYRSSGNVVLDDEALWSSVTNKWVPIGSSYIHTLIAIDDRQICWVNSMGVFHAFWGNVTPKTKTISVAVVPKNYSGSDIKSRFGLLSVDVAKREV